MVVDDEHADAAPGGFAVLPVISVHAACFPGGLPEVVAGRCPVTGTLGTLQAAVGPAGEQDLAALEPAAAYVAQRREIRDRQPVRAAGPPPQAPFLHPPPRLPND